MLGEDGSPVLAPRLSAAEPSRGAAASSIEMIWGCFGGIKSLNCSKKSLGSCCLAERRKHLMFSFIRLGQQII